MNRAAIFAAFRAAKPGLFDDPAWIGIVDGICDDAGIARDGGNGSPCTAVTAAIALELLEHEAIVLEAYKDSRGIWTWGVGVTSRSGHAVERYKDNPQTIKRCLEIYLWLLRERYLVGVLDAFKGYPLTESELGAALSFHYNTGQIAAAEWVRLVKEGKRDQAREAFMNYSRPKEIIARRKAERDLFFDGKWTSDGKVVVYEVGKPSYNPKWSSARLIDVRDALAEALK